VIPSTSAAPPVFPVPTAGGSSSAAALLAAARDRLVTAARAGRGGRAAQARYAAEFDDLVRVLAADAAASAAGASRVVVCALGGYGRRALCLHSDIDLVVVFGGAIGAAEERYVNALLQPLWDLGLTVGHHIRERSELDTADDGNPEFLLALCDLRLIAGDAALFDDVWAATERERRSAAPRRIEALLALGRERHTRFNDTLYHLEPDVKEAPGGLRDVNAIRLVRTLAREGSGGGWPDVSRVDEAEDFLLRVRVLLHELGGRDANILTHDYQEQVADALRSPGDDTHTRVEALMEEYYGHARTIAAALRATIAAGRPVASTPAVRPIGPDLAMSAEGVEFREPDVAASRPALWLDAFRVAVEHGRPLGDAALTVIAENVHRYPSSYFLDSDAGRQQVRALLYPAPGLAARLGEMIECGLLIAIFPEFGKIHGKVVRDFYHKYTVDEHTRLAVRSLESLWQPATASRARFGSILNELRAPEWLTLALLYHDVGKWQDGEHVEESLRLAKPMLARLGLAGEARHSIEFLIGHHLDMARVAFRTDVEDPDTVAKFAGSIASDEHLKLLCLMTLADVEAVGPGTLTPWKEDLLWRLYVDAYTHLTLSYADDLIQKDQAGREAALAQRPADIAEGELIRFLDGLPRRYLAVFDLDTIYGHVRLARGLGVGDVHTTLQKHDDVWELTVAALDQPYLFSDIAGVLAAFGMDIHRGQALTTPDGTALDVFQFTDAEHFLRQNAEAVGEINQVLDGVVAGAFDVSRLLGGRLRGAARRKRPVESRVLVSNEHSQKYTVVEIVAADAPGLLYRISRAMSDAGCEVDLVLISTEGNRAIDVVHITKDGRKLTEPERRGVADRLKRALQGES